MHVLLCSFSARPAALLLVLPGCLCFLCCLALAHPNACCSCSCALCCLCCLLFVQHVLLVLFALLHSIMPLRPSQPLVAEVDVAALLACNPSTPSFIDITSVRSENTRNSSRALGRSQAFPRPRPSGSPWEGRHPRGVASSPRSRAAVAADDARRPPIAPLVFRTL